MKTLYLVRHAKSSWKFEELADHDRPLNKRGRKAAPKMGKLLNELHIKPDLIVSSPAVRAITTATLFAKELAYNQEKIGVIDDIYGAGRDELLQIIRKTPDQINSLMLVGHNNTLTDLGNYLSPKSVANIPTAGVMALEFKANSWSEISQESSRFVFFEYPKKLEEQE